MFRSSESHPSPRSSARRISRHAAVAGAIAVSVCTVAACGSSSSGTTTKSAAKGRTTITIWDQTPAPAQPALDKLIAQYNSSQSKYTVKREFIAGNGDDFTPKILSGIRTGQSPNIILNDSDPASVGQIAATGKVVPLDSLLGTGTYKLNRSDFSSGMLAASTVDGKLDSLPTEGGDFAFIYNKQMFAQAGITTAPTTWAQLATDAKKLSTGGHYGVYLPIGTGEWPVYVWQGLLAAEGGTLLNADNTKATFNSAAGVQALTTWTSMINNGSAYPKSLEDATQAQGLPGFAAKKVAMFVGNVYNIAGAAQAIGANNIGVFKFPEAKQPGMMLGTNVSLLLKGTAQQEAGAYNFLSWFHQPATQAQWASAAGYLPTNLKAQDQPVWKAYLTAHPGVSVFSSQLGYATTRPSITAYPEISTDLSTALQQALTNHANPSSVLDTAAKQADQSLATQ